MIQLYEQRQNDIKKAQLDTVLLLAKALKIEMTAGGLYGLPAVIVCYGLLLKHKQMVILKSLNPARDCLKGAIFLFVLMEEFSFLSSLTNFEPSVINVHSLFTI